MKSIRVLHLIAGMDRRDGGPVTALEGLVRAQAAQGMRPFIMATPAPGEDPTLVRALASDGINVHVPSEAPRFRFRWSPGVVPMLQRLLPIADVVHLHGTWEWLHLKGLAEAHRAGVPAFLRPCGMLDPWALRQGSALKRLWLAALLRPRLRRIEALHLATAREARLVEPLRLSQRQVVVPNGITVPAHQLPRSHAPHARLLYLGRIHPKKGLHLLLPALAQALRSGGAAELFIVGGGASPAYEARVRQQVRGLGIERSVHFMGHLEGDALRSLWSRIDLLVLPSYQENFGNVVVEAAAHGVPSLVSSEVYLVEELESAGAGGRIPFDRSWPEARLVESIRQELMAWISMPQLREEAASKALSFAGRFRWTGIAAQWEELYREAINRRSQASS